MMPQTEISVAGPWARYASALADWTLTRVAMRTDVYVEANYQGKITRRALVNTTLLRAHYTGQVSVALHLISPESRCRSVGIDIDAHRDDSSPDANADAALDAQAAFRERKLDSTIFASDGHGGFHVRAFFNQDVHSRIAHALASDIAATVRRPGVAVEAFPSQAKIDAAHCPYGSALRLPGRHPITGFWTEIGPPSIAIRGELVARSILEIRGSDPSTIVRQYQDAMKPGPQKMFTGGFRHNGKPDTDTVRDALAHLPLEWRATYGGGGGKEPGWIGVGMALHDWDQIAGLDLWHEFSCRDASYKPQELDRKWKSFHSGRGFTMGTIFYYASRNGWTAPWFKHQIQAAKAEAIAIITSSGANHNGDRNEHAETALPGGHAAKRDLQDGDTPENVNPAPVRPVEPRIEVVDELTRGLDQGAFQSILDAQELNARLANLPLDSIGNGVRFASRNSDRVRYCSVWKSWLAWDGARWKKDHMELVRRWAHESVRAILHEASTVDVDRFKYLAKWAIKSASSWMIDSMLKEAAAIPGMTVQPEDLNKDPWVFNFANGTVDLRTGNLRPHDPKDMITQLCPLDYEPDAKCPLWLSTLSVFFHREIPKRKMDLIAYWKRLCGYAMLGIVRDNILPVAYGTGSNGKSTILGTLLKVFGPDYGYKAPQSMLMATRYERHPTEIASIFGKRLMVAIETQEGQRLNESLVKELTGNDVLTARRMREDPWSFQPTHTMILATNHKPVIRGSDKAIWRRIKLIPFSVSLDDDKADKAVPERLEAEISGIARWCVEGCLDYQAYGLEQPSEVENLTKEYQLSEDTLMQFIHDTCVTGPQYTVKTHAIYASFKQWVERAGECAEQSVSQRKLVSNLIERGFRRYHSNGTTLEGIGLRPDYST